MAIAGNEMQLLMPLSDVLLVLVRAGRRHEQA